MSEVGVVDALSIEDDDDLMNIEYGDLLSMVKNLKRSKITIQSKQNEIIRLQNQLKEKTNELNTKCTEVDSLNVLNEQLHSENNLLKSEIDTLKSKNENLHHINKEFETALRHQTKNEITHLQSIAHIHDEFRLLSEKYVAFEEVTRQYDTSIAEEKADKSTLQARIIMMESKYKDLIKENFNLADELTLANRRLTACGGDLAHASNQLYDLSIDLANLDQARRQKEEQKWSQSWEVDLLKADIRRLLHLIEYFPTAEPFLLEWQEARRLVYIGGRDTHSVEEGVMDPQRSDYPHSRRYNESTHAKQWRDTGFRSSAELSHLYHVHGSSQSSSSSSSPLHNNNNNNNSSSVLENKKNRSIEVIYQKISIYFIYLN